MNQTREHLLAALAEMSVLHPEWRLGQMLSNLVFLARNPTTPEKVAEDIWEVEDDELIAVLSEHINRRRQALRDEPLTRDTATVK